MNQIEKSKKSIIKQIISTNRHPLWASFIQQLYNNVCLEFLEEIVSRYGCDFLNKVSSYVWEILQNYTRLHAKIEYHEDQKEPHNFLIILNIDKQFLVDSLSLILKKWQIKAEIIIHPILDVKRDKNGNLKDLKDALSNESIKESLIIALLPQDTQLPKNWKQELEEVFMQVELVVKDYPKTRNLILKIAKTYQEYEALLPKLQLSISQFFTFLDKGNFTCMGYRYFACKVATSSDENLKITFPDEPKYNLGLFNLSKYDHSDLKPVLIDKNITQEWTKSPPFLSILKSIIRAPVHRSSRLDCLEIIDLDENYTICGLIQIIGLFSQDFFKNSPFEVPTVKLKAENLLAQFNFMPQSFDYKLLVQVINSIPLDEFFQIQKDALYGLCLEILNMHSNLVLHVRHDPMKRFMVVMIFMPIQRYNQRIKEKIMAILEEVLQGRITSSHVLNGNIIFTRLIFIVNCDVHCSITYDQQELKQKLNKCSLIWHEQLKILWKEKRHEDLKISFDTFTNNYQEIFSPSEGLVDLEKSFDAFNNSINFSINNDKDKSLNIKVYCYDDPLPLSSLMPTFENFGIKVITEDTYPIIINDKVIWYHLFRCEKGDTQVLNSTINYLMQGFFAVWHKKIENDSFNRLILSCNLSHQQIIIFRFLSKYLTQIGFPYTQKQIAFVLERHPKIVELLWNIFEARFNPIKHNKKMETEYSHKFLLTLKQIKKIEDDRILIIYFNLIQAIVRTNVYQGGVFLQKPYISCKFNSSLIKDLPKPVPLYEIFVYSTTMEGCHLRGGKIARGGIRWSNRFNDFRQEILALMKAQTVKNAVIVPVGAKGGFVVKQYNSKEDVINAYTTLINGMLDLTDNLVNNQIQKPQNTICYDEDDHYLVVAADKGTANFSDVANNIAKNYNFWLHDAFASGGSKGYNHKALGITAKGAWISVQNHLNSLGIDYQKTPIRVAGVGDMAGDVFGNGMLQSNFINLIGAFNRTHIFLDPTPDTKKSYQERLRLFNLPTSTWDDYNKNLLSPGGGVFSRNEKFITLSNQAKKSLQISDEINEIAPDDLIKIILKAPLDLIWFGGIGTFIKASTENNNDAGDHQNDPVRINADQLQAKIIGEGANLGITQRGRIEFAMQGGKINTDAIDNSGGVDCSDHEVNLKILLNSALTDKKITISERNNLLNNLTKEISDLVLKDNFEQNLILNRMEGCNYSSLLHELESNKHLNLSRSLEFLPDDKTIAQRNFTRPELAIILAYSKINLKKELSLALESELYKKELKNYFPKIIQNQFSSYILNHPLRYEILANFLANDLINKLGVHFVYDLEQITGNCKIQIIKNFCEVKFLLSSLELDKLWNHEKWPYLVRVITQIFLVLRTNTLDINKIKIILREWEKYIGSELLEQDIIILPLICQLSVVSSTLHSQKILQNFYNSSINLTDLQKRILNLEPKQNWQKASQVMGVSKLIQLQTQLCFLPQNIKNNHLKNIQNILSLNTTSDVDQALSFMHYIIQKIESLIL